MDLRSYNHPLELIEPYSNIFGLFYYICFKTNSLWHLQNQQH